MAQRVVQLVPLTDAEYAAFAAQHVYEYANQLVRAGEVASEQGVTVSRERLKDLLADRLRTRTHEFLKASSTDGVIVGYLWFAPPPEFLGPGHEHTRWLSQITVCEANRECGFGRAMLNAAEQRLASRGVEQIWLRVFDWNLVAWHLYASLGYQLATKFPIDAHLRKDLRQCPGF